MATWWCVKKTVSLTLSLFGLWLLWSGHYTVMITSFGVASVILCVWLAHRMKIVDDEGHPAHLRARPCHLCALAAVADRAVERRREQACAHWGTSAPAGFGSRRRRRRRSVELSTPIPITLTPGTTSIVLEGDELLVHTIHREVGEDLASGAMAQRVCVFGGAGLMFVVASVGVLVCMALALVRAAKGPTVFDRILAVNNMGTKTVLLIAVLGFLTERPDFSRSGDDLRADQLYRDLRHPQVRQVR